MLQTFCPPKIVQQQVTIIAPPPENTSWFWPWLSFFCYESRVFAVTERSCNQSL